MDLLLGLDVGTTATKALLLNVEGETVASASYSYGLITPREDWVEQDPEELWRGVVETCRKVLEYVNSQDRVLALSISAQGGTTIPVDANGRPVSNAISWMDHRAHEQAKQVRKALGDDRIYEVSGWQLGDGLPLLHISWLRQCSPETYASARYFTFVNDFIIYRLTGQLCMDPSDAGITQLYNIADGRWDEDMLKMAGIGADQLSPVRNSGVVVGQLTAEASRETGLPRSVLVVNGAHDQYCAALGAGVLKPGDVMLSCGTAWVILCLMEQLRLDSERRLSISPHAMPSKWGALKSMGGVGACMEWLLRNLWEGTARLDSTRSALYHDLNKCANSVPVGSRGLIFLPSSGGYGRGSRGAFVGLTLSHSRGDMARAVMEGIAFELRWTMEHIREALAVGATRASSSTLRMVGGAAASPVWPKIVADVTHLPVVLPSATEAASCGAAILAGVGSGAFPSPEAGYHVLSGQEVLLEPDERNGRRYDELFEIYRTVFQQVQSSLSRLSEFEGHGTQG
jgi:xylulokinase